MKEAILLIYRFLRCDTVSRIYCIGKDKIKKSPKLVNIYCDVASIFYNHLSTELNIQETKEKLLLGIHNRVNIGWRNKLGRKIFMEQVARKSVVKQEQLPPTAESSENYFFKVFHQIQTWIRCWLNLLEWGWKVTKSLLHQNYWLMWYARVKKMDVELWVDVERW